jgi:hypothetical protein
MDSEDLREGRSEVVATLDQAKVDVPPNYGSRNDGTGEGCRSSPLYPIPVYMLLPRSAEAEVGRGGCVVCSSLMTLAIVRP